jgi:cytochrome c oxidase subunit 4
MADAHAADHAHDDEHGDDYYVHQHITPVKTYVAVFTALLVLTGLTVAAYNIRLGEWNLFVAVLIAMMKSSLVGAFFMHLKYEQKFNTLFFVGSLIFVGVFLGYTLNDTDRRGEDSVQGLRIDPATGAYAYGSPIIVAEEGEFVPLRDAADGEDAVTQPAPTERQEPEGGAEVDHVEGTVDDDTPGRIPGADAPSPELEPDGDIEVDTVFDDSDAPGTDEVPEEPATDETVPAIVDDHEDPPGTPGPTRTPPDSD